MPRKRKSHATKYNSNKTKKSKKKYNDKHLQIERHHNQQQHSHHCQRRKRKCGYKHKFKLGLESLSNYVILLIISPTWMLYENNLSQNRLTALSGLCSLVFMYYLFRSVEHFILLDIPSIVFNIPHIKCNDNVTSSAGGMIIYGVSKLSLKQVIHLWYNIIINGSLNLSCSTYEPLSFKDAYYCIGFYFIFCIVSDIWCLLYTLIQKRIKEKKLNILSWNQFVETVKSNDGICDRNTFLLKHHESILYAEIVWIITCCYIISLSNIPSIIYETDIKKPVYEAVTHSLLICFIPGYIDRWFFEDDGNKHQSEQAVVTEINKWLNDVVNMGQYIDLFEQNALNNFDVVLKLNNDNLKELGIDKMGHRIQIMQHINIIKEKKEDNKSNIKKKKRAQKKLKEPIEGEGKEYIEDDQIEGFNVHDTRL